MAKLEIPVKVDLDEIDKLIDELRHLQTYKLYEGADQKLVDLDEVVKIFAGHVKAEREQSTIEPERKKGKWIVVSDGYGNGEATACICECSECKDTIWVYKKANRKWNFCPNCGADMKGRKY